MSEHGFCEKAMNALDFPCYVIDVKTYKILLANHEATNYGLKSEKTCYELTHGRTIPCNDAHHPCPLQQIIKNKKSFKTKHIHETNNGQKGIFEVCGCPLFDDKGNVTHMVEYSLDITEEELLRQNLTETENNFIKFEKMATMGELTASIGHEINNPLTVLKGYAQLMKEQKISIEAGLAAQEQAMDRIFHMLKGLKSLSRIDINVDEQLDLNSTIINTLLLIEPLFKKKSIIIVQELEQNLPPIEGNIAAFQQILMNLFSNAKDALSGQKVKKITIATLKTQDHILFRFSDNGMGIPKEHLSKIFDPFFTTKKVGEGSGIGLRVVKDLTTKLKGIIEVESSPGNGATFSFKFPLA